MYARVPQVMVQFVLKIELLSHIMGTTPILEMARTYGLRPRLWLLVLLVLMLVLRASSLPIFMCLCLTLSENRSLRRLAHPANFL